MNDDVMTLFICLVLITFFKKYSFYSANYLPVTAKSLLGEEENMNGKCLLFQQCSHFL